MSAGVDSPATQYVSKYLDEPWAEFGVHELREALVQANVCTAEKRWRSRGRTYKLLRKTYGEPLSQRGQRFVNRYHVARDPAWEQARDERRRARMRGIVFSPSGSPQRSPSPSPSRDRGTTHDSEGRPTDVDRGNVSHAGEQVPPSADEQSVESVASTVPSSQTFSKIPFFTMTGQILKMELFFWCQ